MAGKKPGSEPSGAKVKTKAPDKRERRKTPLTGRGKTGLTRVPPELVDPQFLSEADMAKRELFAQAYVANGRLGPAAAAAGYTGSNKVLQTTGNRLYREPWVAARIKQINDDLLMEMKITQRSVLSELARIGFADMGEVVDENDRIRPLKDIPADTRRALSKYKQTRRVIDQGENRPPVEEIETEVTFEGKSAALKDLGRHAGLWGKEDDAGRGISAEEFARALMEGIGRVIAGKRTIEHKPQ